MLLKRRLPRRPVVQRKLMLVMLPLYALCANVYLWSSDTTLEWCRGKDRAACRAEQEHAQKLEEELAVPASTLRIAHVIST